jgi:ribose-phosphate pyrophosphokinase
VKILSLLPADDVPGDVPYQLYEFPDGQPHFKLDGGISEWDHVQIITRIESAADVLVLGLAVDSVRSLCKGRISVNIAYMLGARMDRRIAPGQPATLHVLAAMLNAACSEAHDVRILDPHSQVTLDLVNRSTAILPTRLLEVALHNIATRHDSIPVVVVPDAGAVGRTRELMHAVKARNFVVNCGKKRDSETGKLSGFELLSGTEGLRGEHCLIVDDLCDGGGTFAGIATVLREAGAKSVSLCVTHGIFSKDLPIQGIDHVYTTDSYSDTWVHMQQDGTTVIADYLRDWVTGPKK